MSSRVRRLCTVAIAAFTLFGANAARAQTTEFPAGGEGHVAALLPTLEVLTLGGYLSDGVSVTDAAVIYAKDGTPTNVGPMVTPRAYATANQLKDGRIVVIGGEDASGPLASIEIFELAPVGESGGTFRPSNAVLQVPRTAHEALTLLDDGRVLIRGGYDAAGNYIEVDEIYNPATDSITLASPDLEYASIFTDKPDYMPGETVYVTGGRWQGGENVYLLFDTDPMWAAPRVFTATANSDGQLQGLASLLIAGGDLYKFLTLHAVGATSSASAVTYFTDANTLQVRAPVGPTIVDRNDTFTITVDVANNAPGKSFVLAAVDLVIPPNWACTAGEPNGQAIPLAPNGNTPSVTTFHFSCATQSASAGVKTVSATFREINPATCQLAGLDCTKTSSTSITVRGDTEPPSLTVPANDVIAEATSASGAVVTFTVAATDAVDPNPTVNCTPASGTTFAIGTTQVSCTASDHATPPNTSAAKTFNVVVRDTTPPTLTVPTQDVIAEATGASGAVATFTASASDIVDGNVATTCNPASGTTFGLGTTTVTCSATDAHHNTGTATFKVTVQDKTPPAVTVPADMTIEATGASGAVATFTASASDIVDGNVGTTCNPASGTTFGLGTTTVTCSATDAHHNTGTATFKVTVQDKTAPAVTVPADMTIEATGASGAVATFTASASDIVDGNVATTCNPASGSTFGITTTTVTCSATDAHHNTGTATFKVTVQDKTAPVITVPGNLSLLAVSSAGRVVTFTTTAEDIVDGPLSTTCNPQSGSTFAPGTTTVTCTARDAHGNSASKSFDVVVSFTFAGFFQPVDNLPATNTVKNGSTVPVKWKLFGDGVQIVETSVVDMRNTTAVQIPCGAETIENAVEFTTTGGTSLRYDATAAQFVLNWQTPKRAGTCWRLEVAFTDGAKGTAHFKLK